MNVAKKLFQKKNNCIFREWLLQIIYDEIQIEYNRELEAKNNLYSFSLSDEEKSKIKVNDLVTLLKLVISIWKKKLIQLNIFSPILFYAWYDEMANSLCFSLVSGTMKEPLPFNCLVEFTYSINKVCLQFLKGKDHIPYEDLEKNLDEWEDPDDQENDLVLTVYTYEL